MLLCSGVGAVISCKGVRWTARNLMSFESDTYPHQLFSWKNFTKYFWSDYIIVFLVFSLLLSCGLIKNKREKNWSGGKDWDKIETGMLVRTNAAVGKEVICWVHVDKWHLWVMKYLQKMSKKKKIEPDIFQFWWSVSKTSQTLWFTKMSPCFIAWYWSNDELSNYTMHTSDIQLCRLRDFYSEFQISSSLYFFPSLSLSNSCSFFPHGDLFLIKEDAKLRKTHRTNSLERMK